MNTPHPFRPKPFLFRLLGAVFLAEFIVIGFSVYRCAQTKPGEPTQITERCPKLGDRTQEMFTLATATILSLLTDTNKTEH
jgi:hypothetical protein